jgi:hypothetical protein
LTREEEQRVLRAYKDILLNGSSGGIKKATKKKAGGVEGDPAATAMVGELDSEVGKGEGEAAGVAPAKAEAASAVAAAAGDAAAEGGSDGGPDAATAAADAIADGFGADGHATAAGPGAGAAAAGLSLAGVRAALVLLDLTLDDDQFARFVAAFFASHGLDPRASDEARSLLELEGFLALVSVVRAPGHSFGGRLRKAASRADDQKVTSWVAALHGLLPFLYPSLCSCARRISQASAPTHPLTKGARLGGARLQPFGLRRRRLHRAALRGARWPHLHPGVAPRVG